MVFLNFVYCCVIKFLSISRATKEALKTFRQWHTKQPSIVNVNLDPRFSMEISDDCAINFKWSLNHVSRNYVKWRPRRSRRGLFGLGVEALRVSSLHFSKNLFSVQNRSAATTSNLTNASRVPAVAHSQHRTPSKPNDFLMQITQNIKRHSNRPLPLCEEAKQWFSKFMCIRFSALHSAPCWGQDLEACELSTTRASVWATRAVRTELVKNTSSLISMDGWNIRAIT